MDGFRNQNQDQVIQQMTRVVLAEMLERVVREFERTTGTTIGAVHIRAAESVSGDRRTEIEIRHAERDSLDALLSYKKILCEYESFMNEAFCSTSSEDIPDDEE